MPPPNRTRPGTDRSLGDHEARVRALERHRGTQPNHWALATEIGLTLAHDAGSPKTPIGISVGQDRWDTSIGSPFTPKTAVVNYIAVSELGTYAAIVKSELHGGGGADLTKHSRANIVIAGDAILSGMLLGPPVAKAVRNDSGVSDWWYVVTGQIFRVYDLTNETQVWPSVWQDTGVSQTLDVTLMLLEIDEDIGTASLVAPP